MSAPRRKHSRFILNTLSLAVIGLSACATQSPRLTNAPVADEISFANGTTFSNSRRELTILLPQVDLPAGLTYADIGVVTSLETTAPLDGWIHGYAIEVIDSAGTVARSKLLHHISVISPDQRELFSPIMLRVVAAGMETGAVRMPDSYGYPVTRGQRLSISAMLHNPDSVARGAMRVRVRLAITPATRGKTPALAFPFHLAINDPATNPSFDLPAGRSVQHRDASPAISGRVYALGGHLHQYGVSLKLEDVTTGRVVWSSIASRDSSGNILQIPNNRFPKLGVRIEAGHVYRVTSEYNNTTGEDIADGGMGLVGGLFIPDRNNMWPLVDATNAIYQKDVASHTASAHSPAHKHGGLSR